LRCRTFVDGRPVGEGSIADLPGGPFEALRFLLEHCARRRRPLKAGMLASTGALTGIHDVLPGQLVRIDFGEDGAIPCRIVAATPNAQAMRVAQR
jgi:2-keto-4-pentenoate hydratase